MAAQTSSPSNIDTSAFAVPPDPAATVRPVVQHGVFEGKSSGGRRPQNAESVHRALRWLAANQQDDGNWGDAGHRTLLTSTATLAFLSHHETTNSAAYGQTVTRSMNWLLLNPQETREPDTPSEQAAAIRAWALAEAGLQMNDPKVREAAIASALSLSTDNPTPWHAQAWRTAMNLCSDQSDIRETLAQRISGVSTSAYGTAQLESMCSDTLWSNWSSSTASSGSGVKPANPAIANWQTMREPLLCAVLLARTLPESAPLSWRVWQRFALPAVAAQQVRMGTSGWWDTACLHLTNSVEMAGLSESEARTYSTALTVMLIQPAIPSGGASPGRPPAPAATNRAESIRIEII